RTRNVECRMSKEDKATSNVQHSMSNVQRKKRGDDQPLSPRAETLRVFPSTLDIGSWTVDIFRSGDSPGRHSSSRGLRGGYFSRSGASHGSRSGGAASAAT